MKYDLEPSPPIGDGTYSICLKCRKLSNKQIYAVKIVHADHNVDREIQMLEACSNSPYVVRLVEVLRDSAYTYIVMELLQGGELLQRITQTEISEYKAKKYFEQIVKGVMHMHQQKIIHRDLKPENILFVSAGKDDLKIVDFGFAKRISAEVGDQTPCFTVDYAAPEVLLNSTKAAVERARAGGEGIEQFLPAVDLWSMGVILYTMLCGQSPFSLTNDERRTTGANSKARIQLMVKKIVDGSFDLANRRWLGLSVQAQNLVKGLLSVSVNERLKINDLLQHEWFQKALTIPVTEPTTMPLNGAAKTQLMDGMRDTYDALKLAQKQGFCLRNVNNSKLAKRRQLKRTSSSSSSSVASLPNGEWRKHANESKMKSGSTSTSSGNASLLPGKFQFIL
jgi:serine/threonine protein kinase